MRALHTITKHCIEFKILLGINSVNIVDWTSHKLCIPLLCHLICGLRMCCALGETQWCGYWLLLWLQMATNA